MNDFKGSLYGFIVGDALGVPVEFMKREQLIAHPVTGMLANKQRNTSIGYWSDDTAMTLCTMQSIIEKNEIDYKDIMDKFLMWLETGYMTANDECFGIGQRTLKALMFYKRELKNPTLTKSYKNNDWLPLVGSLSEPANEARNSGNGSLMRILPAVFYMKKFQLTLYVKIMIISNLSSITHANKECIASCIYYMFFIEQIIKTKDVLKSFEVASQNLKANYDLNDCGPIDRIINKEFWNLSINDIKGTGYVIDTLEASLWCLYNSNNYESAVLKAVNLGDDTDTVAAITGSLAGLYYGYESIPKEWLDSLMKKDLIDKTIADFSIL